MEIRKVHGKKMDVAARTETGKRKDIRIEMI
jgi:hypothetical protein